MKKINDAVWCAQDLIKSALLIHVGSQNEFFTTDEQEALGALRLELERLNKKASDIISKKPDPNLITESAFAGLEAILSKEDDDTLFDLGLDAHDLINEIERDLDKENRDDL